MKKLIAIFFLSIFSVSAMDAAEVFKLPRLIHHFIDHNKKENETNFLHFLKEHYLTDHRDDGDQKEDSRLPFKEINVNSFSSVFLLSNSVEIRLPVLDAHRQLTSYNHLFISSLHLFGIFRPPRLS